MNRKPDPYIAKRGSNKKKVLIVEFIFSLLLELRFNVIAKKLSVMSFVCLEMMVTTGALL